MPEQKLKDKKKPLPVTNDIKDDNIGGSSAGGVAGTGGVSTNDVGVRTTSKAPRLDR